MSAPKKTKRKAKGDEKKVGRPLIIKNSAEMDRLVDEYRAQCLADKEPVTLTGLILHLGLSSRQSLDDYGKRPEFIDSVKRAKLIVECEYEKRLANVSPTGAIFALKNMGWSDRQEHEHSGPNGGPIQHKDMTDEELRQELARLGFGRQPGQLASKRTDGSQ